MDLLYIVRVLINRLPILAVISILAASITATLTYLAPKKYRSSAQLSTGYTVTNSYSLTEERFSLVEADLKFNNLIEIMNSNILIGTISHHLLLHDLERSDKFSKFTEGKEDNWLADLYGIPLDTVIAVLNDKVSRFELLSSFDSTEKVIAQLILDHNFDPQSLRKSMAIKRTNYTDYLTVQFESENPFYSAFVVNNLSEEFLRYNNTLRFTQSSESMDFLSGLANQKREVLETKSNNLRRYKSRNQFLNFDIESESKIAQVKEAEKDREETLNNINRINLSIQSIDGRLDGQTTQNNSDNRFGSIPWAVEALREQLTDLNERRRNQIGDYQALSDSIFIIRNQLDNLVSASGALDEDLLNERDGLNVELKVEEEKLNSLNRRLANLKGQVSSFASTEANISSLQREVDIAAQEYLEVQDKLNDARNATLNAKDDIKIILYGQPAIEHQSTGLILKTLLALIASLVVCTAIILFLELIDPRVKTASRFQQMLDIKLLGVVDERGNGKKLFKKKKGHQPLALSPSLRKLRYNITTQEGRILLITSLKAGEGKSTIIHSLANALGLIGKKVLIVDTNFRSNIFFRSMSKNGTKRIKAAESAQRVVEDNQSNSNNGQSNIFESYFSALEDNENVHIVPNKGPEGSAAEVLAGKEFSELLAQLIRDGVYDYILLEGAALNDFSDSIELSTYAEKVILVVDAMAGFRQEDQQTLKLINNFNGKMMGGILNREMKKV